MFLVFGINRLNTVATTREMQLNEEEYDFSEELLTLEYIMQGKRDSVGEGEISLLLLPRRYT